MNSEDHQRKFDFYNTRIVRRDFQFNNRNNFRRHNVWHRTSRGHELREESKHKKQWFQKRGTPNARSQAAASSFATVGQYRPYSPKPQSQAAASSFATVGQHRPFTPRLPFNLTITIPNFSDARPSNVFRFHNSTAKSVLFAPAPPATFPQSSNRGSGDNALKSNETGINEDVEYLYTVQTKGGELVEVVDISEDSDVPNCSDESRICDPHLSSNVSNCSNESIICDPLLSSNVPICSNESRICDPHLSSNVSNCSNESIICDTHLSSNVSEKDNDRMILKIPEKETIPSSKKQGAVRRAGKKRKKSTDDLHCDICASEFEFVRSRGEEIFKSKCGHMFCQLCLKGLYPYKCPECNIFLYKLLKVFF